MAVNGLTTPLLRWLRVPGLFVQVRGTFEEPPTRLIFPAIGEVLSFGFNLAVSLPSGRKGCKARIEFLPSRLTRWGLYHIACVYPSTSCHLA